MKIDKTKLLLVEGLDEVNFFIAFCKHIDSSDLQIIETGGKEKLKLELPALLLAPGFEQVQSLGIVQDADNSLEGTVARIKSLLAQLNLPVPKGHADFKEVKKKKTGIYIMPGNRDNGMLENLVLDTVNDHPVLKESDKYIEILRTNLSQDEGPKFPRNEHKARLLAYLSGMEKTVSSLGLAAQKGYFNFDSEHLDELKQFIKTI